MDRPRFQVSIGTIMTAVAVAAVFSFLSTLPSRGYVAMFSVPLMSCIAASHTFSRCRAEGRKPTLDEWVKAGCSAMMVAGLIQLACVFAGL